MTVAAEGIEGDEVPAAIERLLARDEIAYLHLHNAGPGCFNCRAERA